MEQLINKLPQDLCDEIISFYGGKCFLQRRPFN